MGAASPVRAESPAYMASCVSPACRRRRPGRLRSAVRWVAALAATAVLTACSALSIADAVTPRSGYRSVETVSYGPNAAQFYERYEPTRPRAGAPLVAFVHGGGWTDGAPDGYRFVAQALAEEGHAVALVGYRLYPTVAFPAFVEDGAAAIESLALDAPAGIVLMGHSAGAQIAALLAFDERYLERAGVARCTVRGFVGLSGPYDFLPLENPVYRSVFPEPLRAASQPIAFVDGTEAPAFLATGADDDTVAPRNSSDMAGAIARAGGTARLEFYAGLGHIDTIAAFVPPFRGRPVLGDVAAFLRGLSTRPRCP